MRQFSAIHVLDGGLRRVVFEAMDDNEALETARKWGIGLEGETNQLGPVAPQKPSCFEVETARQLLGGISRATIYRLIQARELERVAGTRRVLITRTSIERFAAHGH